MGPYPPLLFVPADGRCVVRGPAAKLTPAQSRCSRWSCSANIRLKERC